ncbi:adck1 [Symbiodinium necroappetens]|uniref:Adck1 protein n=1 Tax=Symbiodinium necroappetens TaxID=1628268 RepID=A0A813C3Z4_9DINO|nr:adck1 [Symbiodinium necroappetens]
MPPGTRYIHCEKSIAADPIGDLFGRVEKQARIPSGPNGKEQVDPRWVKDNIPFCGEAYLAHVRYGTDSENSLDRPDLKSRSFFRFLENKGYPLLGS